MKQLSKHLIQSLIIILGVTLLSNAKAQYYEYYSHVDAGDSLYEVSEFKKSSEEYAKAFIYEKCLDPTDLYNGACSAALSGDNDNAFKWLWKCLETDCYFYMENPRQDDDLANLYTDSRWKSFEDTMTLRKKRIEQNFDKNLRQELQQIWDDDQKIRHKLTAAEKDSSYSKEQIDEIFNKMVEIDSINRIKICKILDNRGFVGREIVGDKCRTLWIVIQHSPYELQIKYLPLFKKAVLNKDLKAKDYALMEDRIAVRENRPQKYGTQIVHNKLWPLLDSTKVNIWREEVGLKPLEIKLQQYGITLE